MVNNKSELFDLRRCYAGKVLPNEQVELFQNSQQAFPVREIAASSQPRVLARKECDLTEFEFESRGTKYDIYDYISRNRISGLLLMKSGQLVFENYQNGNHSDSHWLSMSMAKSIASTLVGVAIAEGLIGGLDDPLTQYLPELSAGAYADVTIRQLLLMSSGVEWNEDQTNPRSHRSCVLSLQIEQHPGSITQYMSELPKLAPAGSRWNYSTGETHIVGSLIKAATGRWLSDYLSEKIWQPVGMESNAHWWLEAESGLEVAGSGFGATLRDYARFAQFVMDGGKIGNKFILPQNWLDQAAGPTKIGATTVPYGFMWWSLPDQDGSYHRRAFSARGIFGQRIYINPADQSLAVIWCLRSKPVGDDPVIDNDFFNAFSQLSIS